MATSYPLPSWLQTHPDDVANKFVSGLQIGASLGEARNRLQQSANQFAVEADQKQQQINASALKEAQELEVQKAYQGQQVALKQQQLQAVQEKVGLETVKAARQFQAQQQYQKDFQAGVDSGLSEDEAARSSLFKNLSMFGSGAGAASAAMRMATPTKQASVPQTMDVADISGKPHRYIYRGPGSTMHEVGGGSDKPGFFTQRDYVALQSELKGLQKAQTENSFEATSKNALSRKNYTDRAARIQQINDQLKQLRGGTQPPSAGASTAAATTAERVKVRSPDGSTGTIPKSQLDDAIDAGYEQVD